MYPLQCIIGQIPHVLARGGTGLLEDQTHGGLLVISSQQPYDCYDSNDNAYDDRRMCYNISDDKLWKPKPIGHGPSPRLLLVKVSGERIVKFTVEITDIGCDVGDIAYFCVIVDGVRSSSIQYRTIIV